LSRVQTTLRTLLDPRKEAWVKAANLGTGARFTDVEMEKEKAKAARTFIEEALAGDPNIRTFRNLYVPRAQQGQLNPREVLLMRLYRTLEDEAKIRAAAGQPLAPS
jgi:hypothetical protein